MKNKNLLIGAVAVVVGYLLWKKSQKDELNKRVQNLTKNNEIQTDSLGMPRVKPSTPEEEKALHDILVKMLPNNFVIKSDGYNTTYVKQSAPLGNTSTTVYSKISGKTDGSFGMGSPIGITYKEFQDAYNEFKNQPK